MKPYPLVDDLVRPVLRVAMQRAVGSAAFLARYLPARGRRRIIPVPPQIQALGGQKVSGTFSAPSLIHLPLLACMLRASSDAVFRPPQGTHVTHGT